MRGRKPAGSIFEGADKPCARTSRNPDRARLPPCKR